MPPFVITGCGRSGTMGMASLLNRAGVRTSFEEFFCARIIEPFKPDYVPWLNSTGTVGEVSGLAPPYLPGLPQEVSVLHQVRNPVATLASLMGEWESLPDDRAKWLPNIKFNRRYLGDLSHDDKPIVFYMKYWLLWNEMIEPWANWRYRIEDIQAAGDTWNRLLLEVGVPASEATADAIGRYTNNYNSRQDRGQVTWRSIPNSQLKHRILQKAIFYGYTEAELDAYCPCPDGCPHCHKEFRFTMSAKHVLIQAKFERYFRTTGNSTVGLIDMYTAADVVGKVGVEVGCARGESSEIACNFLGHLYCVDPYGEGFGTNELFFDERMAAVPNHTKVKKESHEACGDFDDEFFDIAYIDGMHDYENAKRDFLCWFRKVKMGGWFAGHDYDERETHTEVVLAVDEVFGQPRLRFEDGSFLFRKTYELVGRVNRLFPDGYVSPPESEPEAVAPEVPLAIDPEAPATVCNEEAKEDVI